MTWTAHLFKCVLDFRCWPNCESNLKLIAQLSHLCPIKLIALFEGAAKEIFLSLWSILDFILCEALFDGKVIVDTSNPFKNILMEYEHISIKQRLVRRVLVLTLKFATAAYKNMKIKLFPNFFFSPLFYATF